MKKLNSKGFTTLELALIVGIVLIIGIAGYSVYQSKNNNMPEATNTEIGGPADGRTVASEIKLVTGVYLPADIDIKKGTTVTWKIEDSGEIPSYGIENNKDSTETFSSPLLKSRDTFSHTFNEVGTFGWHDKYQGGLKGTVVVTE